MKKPEKRCHKTSHAGYYYETDTDIAYNEALDGYDAWLAEVASVKSLLSIISEYNSDEEAATAINKMILEK